MICSLIWPSFFCYFSTLAIERVSTINHTIKGLNWFDQPVELQKYIILMVLRSQERMYFSGLGLITCSLEVFGKVCIALSKTTKNSFPQNISFPPCSFSTHHLRIIWYSDAYLYGKIPKQKNVSSHWKLQNIWKQIEK